MAAAVPISGTPARPSSRPSAPATLRVPIGNVSHDSGTPALAMPGRIGLRCAMAPTPDSAVAAMATRVTVTYAVCMVVLRWSVRNPDGVPDGSGVVENVEHVVGDVSA